jgi:hypothetical protein
MHWVSAFLHNTASSYFGRAARIPFHLKSFQEKYPEGASMSIKSAKAKVPPSSNWINLQKVRSKLSLVFFFVFENLTLTRFFNM